MSPPPCIVSFCKNRGTHLFPSDEIRKAQWIQQLNIETVRNHSKLCQLIKPTDFSRTPLSLLQPGRYLIPIGILKSKGLGCTKGGTEEKRLRKISKCVNLKTRVVKPVTVSNDKDSGMDVQEPIYNYNSVSNIEGNVQLHFDEDHSYCGDSYLLFIPSEGTTSRLTITDPIFKHIYKPWEVAQPSSDIFKHGEVTKKVSKSTGTYCISHCTGHPDLILLKHEALPQPGQIFASRDKFIEHMNSNARQWKFYIACEQSEFRSKTYIYRCAKYKIESKYTSKGIRKKDSKKTACPCTIRLRHITKDQAVVVTFVCHHHDHPLTEESFLEMAHGKHFPKDLKQEIKDLLFLGVRSEIMRKYIASKTGFDMDMKYFSYMKKMAQTNARAMIVDELKILTAKSEELEKLYGDSVPKRNTSQTSTNKRKRAPQKRGKKSSGNNSRSEPQNMNIEANSEVSLLENTEIRENCEEQSQLTKRLNSDEPALSPDSKMGRLETYLQIMSRDEETMLSMQKLQESFQDRTKCSSPLLQTNLWHSNLISHDIQTCGKDTNVFILPDQYEYDDNIQESELTENNDLEELEEAYEAQEMSANDISCVDIDDSRNLFYVVDELPEYQDNKLKDLLNYNHGEPSINYNLLLQLQDERSKFKEESSNLKIKLASISSNYEEALTIKELLLKENLELKNKLSENEKLSKLKEELSNLKEKLATVTSDCAKALLIKDLLFRENLKLKTKLCQNDEILLITEESSILKEKLATLSSEYAKALSTKDMLYKENLELKSKLYQEAHEDGLPQMKLVKDKLKSSKAIQKLAQERQRNELDGKELHIAEKEPHIDMNYVRRKKNQVNLRPFLDAFYHKAVQNVNRKTSIENKQDKCNGVKKIIYKPKINKAVNSRVKETLIPVCNRGRENKRNISSELCPEDNNLIERNKRKTKDKTFSIIDDDLMDASKHSDSGVVLYELEKNDMSGIEVDILDLESGTSDMEIYETEVLDTDFDL